MKWYSITELLPKRDTSFDPSILSVDVIVRHTHDDDLMYSVAYVSYPSGRWVNTLSGDMLQNVTHWAYITEPENKTVQTTKIDGE